MSLASEENSLSINDRVRIPLSAVEYRFARSSGPGGQNTNKSETNVELLFDILHAPYFTEDERARVMTKLGGQIDKEGVLHLESQHGRSQLRNREEVTARFIATLRQALIVPKKRRKTKPSKAAKAQRVNEKRRAGAMKQARREKIDY